MIKRIINYAVTSALGSFNVAFLLLLILEPCFSLTTVPGSITVVIISQVQTTDTVNLMDVPIVCNHK